MKINKMNTAFSELKITEALQITDRVIKRSCLESLIVTDETDGFIIGIAANLITGQSIDIKLMSGRILRNSPINEWVRSQTNPTSLPYPFLIINKKHQTEYLATGERIDCTNNTDGRVMVDYETLNKDMKFCREKTEFFEKFEVIG